MKDKCQKTSYSGTDMKENEQLFSPYQVQSGEEPSPSKVFSGTKDYVLKTHLQISPFKLRYPKNVITHDLSVQTVHHFYS